MTVRYVRVQADTSALFTPAVRSYGNIAIVGTVTPPTAVAIAAGTAGAAESGTTVTITTTSAHGFAVGDDVTIAGVGVAGYNGGFLITAIPNPTSFTYTNAATGLAASGGGTATNVAAPNAPVLFTDPTTALRRCPGDLGNAIALAFRQTPGPSLIYGVRAAEGPPVGWAAALTAVETLEVQFVVLANVALASATAAAAAGGTAAGAILQLAQHVVSVSNTGGDGMERMGVAMLVKNSTDPTIVSGDLATDRMVYVAHKSTQDVAAAVAGTIAGYEPHISMLLKPVNVSSDSFPASAIDTLNGAETNFDSPPAGQGVNWLADPVLIPGRGVYLGEGYTGNPGGGVKFIDVRRTIDDISFRLKARLINSIGNVRISRSGLRALLAQMEAELDPLVAREVIDGYTIVIPILLLLEKNPATLTASELAQISAAHANRLVQVTVELDYAGAIHRLAIKLKFV
jgi:hypothetical protein